MLICGKTNTRTVWARHIYPTLNADKSSPGAHGGTGERLFPQTIKLVFANIIYKTWSLTGPNFKNNYRDHSITLDTFLLFNLCTSVFRPQYFFSQPNDIPRFQIHDPKSQSAS